MRTVKVWDPLVRIFHWGVVTGVLLNIFVLDDESKLHRQVGYAVAILLAIRLLWGFVGSKYARFNSFPPSASGALEQIRDTATRRRRAHLGHTPLGALMIYNIMATIVVITASGYIMTTDAYWGVEWPEEVHEIAVTWLEISAVIHVLAVIFESVRTGINLPLAMFSGKKSVSGNVEIVE